MSLVYDRRTTILFAFFGLFFLASGLWRVRTGEPVEVWLVSVTVGALWCVLVADGLQRRLRGDPRTREKGLDRRTNAAVLVAFAALVPIGLWSYWQGHNAFSWGLLLGGGLVAIALGLWRQLTLPEDGQSAPDR